MNIRMPIIPSVSTYTFRVIFKNVHNMNKDVSITAYNVFGSESTQDLITFLN